MHLRDKIYVAGHHGLAGSALVRRLQASSYSQLIVRTHAELELTDQREVERFFSSERPDYVFLAAAKVGGILANDTYPADFITENLAIQSNVIGAAQRHGIKRLLFLGSSCVYPRDCPQPIKEEYLLTGPLEPTNRPYAIAKIAGIEMCWSFNRQHHTRFLAVMPTNLYGPGDNYDLQNSHVLPALISKMHEAKIRGDRQVIIWGTGTPRREFLYSDDMADACLMLMQLPDDQFDLLIATRLPDPGAAPTHEPSLSPQFYPKGERSTTFPSPSSPTLPPEGEGSAWLPSPSGRGTEGEGRFVGRVGDEGKRRHGRFMGTIRGAHPLASLPPLINIGCGVDLTVRELAETIAKVVGFGGELTFDPSKPDGTPRKQLDVSRLFGLDWRPKIGLYDGIVLAYQAYQVSLKT